MILCSLYQASPLPSFGMMINNWGLELLNMMGQVRHIQGVNIGFRAGGMERSVISHAQLDASHILTDTEFI